MGETTERTEKYESFKNIGILEAGTWGMALARMLSNKGA